MSTKAQKIARLKDKEYRDAFVASQISVGLPFQIRALREAKGWKQSRLAAEANMLQPRISAMESPGGAKFNLETLRRLASAFDVALTVRFVPFSELVDWSDKFEPDNFRVPSFAEEVDTNADKTGDSAAVAARIENPQQASAVFLSSPIDLDSIGLPYADLSPTWTDDKWADHMTLQTMARSFSNSVTQPLAGSIVNSAKVRSITSSPLHAARRKNKMTDTIRYGQQMNTVVEQVGT